MLHLPFFMLYKVFHRKSSDIKPCSQDSSFFVLEAEIFFLGFSHNDFLDPRLTWHSNSPPWMYATETGQTLELTLNFAPPRNRPGGWVEVGCGWVTPTTRREEEAGGKMCGAGLAASATSQEMGKWRMVPGKSSSSSSPQHYAPAHSPLEDKPPLQGSSVINKGKGEEELFFSVSALPSNCLHCPQLNQSSIGVS